MDERFTDRTQAGHRLAKALAHLAGTPGLLVLGLPRGGVVVAAPVAAALDATLDILVVAKAGVPWQPELALGAVSADGHRVVNEDVVRRARLGGDEVDASLAAATDKAAHRCGVAARRTAASRLDRPRGRTRRRRACHRRHRSGCRGGRPPAGSGAGGAGRASCTRGHGQRSAAPGRRSGRTDRPETV